MYSPCSREHGRDVKIYIRSTGTYWHTSPLYHHFALLPASPSFPASPLSAAPLMPWLVRTLRNR